MALDKTLKVIPGLVTSIAAILTLLTGTGLGHESWEASTQKAAGFIGVIVSVTIVVLFDDADKGKKRFLIKVAFWGVIVFFILDILAGFIQSIFAKYGLEIPLARDYLWRILYLAFCISVIWWIGCLALLIPNVRDTNN